MVFVGFTTDNVVYLYREMYILCIVGSIVHAVAGNGLLCLSLLGLSVAIELPADDISPFNGGKEPQMNELPTTCQCFHGRFCTSG